MLARLPLLHPDGLHAERRARGRANRCVAPSSCAPPGQTPQQRLARLDALLEILGPAWHAALGADLANKTPLRFLAPATPTRTSQAAGPRATGPIPLPALPRRLGRGPGRRLLAAAAETLHSGPRGLDYADLAEDIAIEARLALQLTEEIKELDERIAILLDQADPHGIMTSVPGRRPRHWRGRSSAAWEIPTRFASLAGVRSFTGLVPTWTPPACPAGTAARPNPGTRCYARHCSWPPTTPDASTPAWPPNTTG